MFHIHSCIRVGKSNLAKSPNDTPWEVRASSRFSFKTLSNIYIRLSSERASYCTSFGSPFGCFSSRACECTRSWEPRTQKLMSHLLRSQSLKVLSIKPGVGQCISIHAMLTTRDLYLANFYPSGPFACIFSKTSPEFFLC